MGKPLLAYTAESALRARLLSCVVSTEDEEVAEVGRQCDYFGEVEGQTTYSCTLSDGRHVHGHDFLQGQWTWRYHPWKPWVRCAQLQAKSLIYDNVTVVIVDEPGQDRFYLLCLETTLSSLQLIRRWRRRHWIEFVFRVLKHLLTTESCQAHSENTYYVYLEGGMFDGEFHAVLHFTGDLQRPPAMEAIIFSLKHYWRFVGIESLELQTLS